MNIIANDDSSSSSSRSGDWRDKDDDVCVCVCVCVGMPGCRVQVYRACIKRSSLRQVPQQAIIVYRSAEHSSAHGTQCSSSGRHASQPATSKHHRRYGRRRRPTEAWSSMSSQWTTDRPTIACTQSDTVRGHRACVPCRAVPAARTRVGLYTYDTLNIDITSCCVHTVTISSPICC